MPRQGSVLRICYTRTSEVASPTVNLESLSVIVYYDSIRALLTCYVYCFTPSILKTCFFYFTLSLSICFQIGNTFWHLKSWWGITLILWNFGLKNTYVGMQFFSKICFNKMIFFWEGGYFLSSPTLSHRHQFCLGTFELVPPQF